MEIENTNTVDFPGPLSEPDEAQLKVTPLEILGAVIVSPRKAFRQLSEHPQWLLPSLILVLWLLLVAGSFLAQMVIAFSQMPEETTDALPGFGRLFYIVMGAVQAGMGIFALAIVFSLMTATLYLLCRLSRMKLRLFPLVSGLALAEFVPRLTGLAVKEVGALFSDNPAFNFGGSLYLSLKILRIFSPIELPHYLWPLLNRLEPFHVWSFALIVVLVHVMGNSSLKRGILVSAIYWCICTAAVIGFFGGMEIIGNLMGSIE